MIDAAETSIETAERRLRAFVDAQGIRRLNVAGPRASGEARGYAYARELVGAADSVSAIDTGSRSVRSADLPQAVPHSEDLTTPQPD